MIFLIIILCGVCSIQCTRISGLGKPKSLNPVFQQIEESHNSQLPGISADEEFYQKRSIETYKDGLNGNYPYPSNFKVSKNIDEFSIIFTKNGNKSESIAGRVYRIRKNTVNETIYDIKSENGDFVVQVIINARNYESYDKYVCDTTRIQRGDIVGVTGFAGEIEIGILTFHANHITLLAPCLHLMPLQMDEKNRLSHRYLDFIINEKTKEIFHKRAKAISTIRRFLDNKGYLEVETPVLNKVPGGARAPSFKTHNDYENSNWYLRISPELYHKMLIVGGFNKVYEIGRQFRNEKSDLTHNPEFTTVEFYTAYANYSYLFDIIESLLSDLVLKVHGSYKIDYKGSELDFQGPYSRIPMIPTLEERLNITFPPADTFNSIESNEFLYKLCLKLGVKIPRVKTSANLLGILFENIIVSNIVQPTFVTDYPEICSPLAKSHPNSPGLTQRLELFVLGKELANAYVELNDPQIQRERFAQQDAERAAGDDEIPRTDEEFLTALEYGLPPTAGVGMGIDRIVMFLTNATSIKDVILFPNTKT